MKVCIIGAGSSGITAAKTLKENGIAFDCFEKGSNMGGNWRYNNDNGMSSAYRSLHINTNRLIMAYSDYPMPDHYPMFPHHSHIIQYFEDYVDHFGVRPHIQFNTEVLDVTRNADNTYRVKTSKGETDYRAVLVCNGHHWNARFPEPAFAGSFTGEVLHSHYYREPEQIYKKDLLVVGIGNSAVDIACEAARQCTQNKVVISTRSGAYIVPNWIWSIPFDSLASSMMAKLPLRLQRVFLKVALWLARGNQEDYGVPQPKRPPLSEHPTLSQDLLNLCGRGLIKFKPNIKELRGKTVTFEDGTAQDFDQIVYATGYKVTFPFLKEQIFQVEDSNDFGLYKKVVHPNWPNLFFVALIQPLGAIMPLAEVQSKWIARLLNGTNQLPTPNEMRRDIEKDRQAMQKRYKNSPRHTLQVDFHPYKESIEKEMKRVHVVA
ncbi:MAG: NAD(P)/FAD-dependent oxidoreductase [Cytophagia bacterium]|nr:MAG: NAD(P)/FAD-dependent oxidoreductase [Runella sp.]TAG24016.1 MAG: NAD(P)/FAD-dependent oxidoreductase [Cytophagales bacterium]TAG34665.1 MAG: NAD(P)/FAD-dependent oxidoreductase [Cytophagia bacterium]TAG56885.1 MAG: NAD(P)/FAD-dependent oxidoreductase [Runella slithyformis]TAG70665.1 MAG: NAD(P)/FAD-dependent oxidoreductase [Runella slithyformis]